MNPGPSTACTGTIKAQDNLVYRLMEMFPEACPKYLKNICENHTFSIECLNALITKLLDGKYILIIIIIIFLMYCLYNFQKTIHNAKKHIHLRKN